MWPQQRHLKKETEGLLMAEQGQPLRTTAIKPNIGRSGRMTFCAVSSSSFHLIGAADNIKRLMRESMASWKTPLIACGKDLGEVSIRGGIFQGESLSPLLFVIAMLPLSSVLNESAAGYQLKNEESQITHLLFMDDLKLYGRNEKEINSLVHTIRVFSSDIGMDFGIKKCAMMVMKRGNLAK